MSRSRTRSSKKKTVTIAVLVACLLLAAIGGTIAWLTTQDSLTNKFAVGNFNDPETDPTDPDNPDLPKDDPDRLNGHLWEPHWDAKNNKITPGTTLTKDPYVGIGKDSENAYVYVYVKNSAKDPQSIYFKLNPGWSAVNATEAKDLKNNDPGYKDAPDASYYTGGLFKYDAGLIAKADGDSWTVNPVFFNVFVRNSATNETLAPEERSDFTALKVTALLHQMTSGDGETSLESDADTWAITEAEKLADEKLTNSAP